MSAADRLAPRCVYCGKRCWPWQMWGGRWLAERAYLAWHAKCFLENGGRPYDKWFNDP